MGRPGRVADIADGGGPADDERQRDGPGGRDVAAERGRAQDQAEKRGGAKKEARRYGAKPIELVNGDNLVELFESLELGVTPRVTFLP